MWNIIISLLLGQNMSNNRYILKFWISLYIDPTLPLTLNKSIVWWVCMTEHWTYPHRSRIVHILTHIHIQWSRGTITARTSLQLKTNITFHIRWQDALNGMGLRCVRTVSSRFNNISTMGWIAWPQSKTDESQLCVCHRTRFCVRRLAVDSAWITRRSGFYR